MKKFRTVTLLLGTLAFLAVPLPGLLAQTHPGTLIRVIDGDSLLVDVNGIEENIRLIGIDAPETQDNPKAEKDAERDSEALAQVLSRGKEAARFARSFLHPGERVLLETDRQQRDPYGRLLAYVLLPNGDLVNEKMVWAGYAVPLVVQPNTRFQKRIQAAYALAREAHRGLWSSDGGPAGLHERLHEGKKPVQKKRAKRNVKMAPGPQTEVTDQKEVSGQREVLDPRAHRK